MYRRHGLPVSPLANICRSRNTTRSNGASCLPILHGEQYIGRNNFGPVPFTLCFPFYSLLNQPTSSFSRFDTVSQMKRQSTVHPYSNNFQIVNREKQSAGELRRTLIFDFIGAKHEETGTVEFLEKNFILRGMLVCDSRVLELSSRSAFSGMHYRWYAQQDFQGFSRVPRSRLEFNSKRRQRGGSGKFPSRLAGVAFYSTGWSDSQGLFTVFERSSSVQIFPPYRLILRTILKGGSIALSHLNTSLVPLN